MTGEYVVVEFNQASHRPRIYTNDVHDGPEGLRYARHLAASAQKATDDIGRRETYAIYELTEVEDDA